MVRNYLFVILYVFSCVYGQVITLVGSGYVIDLGSEKTKMKLHALYNDDTPLFDRNNVSHSYFEHSRLLFYVHSNQTFNNSVRLQVENYMKVKLRTFVAPDTYLVSLSRKQNASAAVICKKILETSLFDAIINVSPKFKISLELKHVILEEPPGLYYVKSSNEINPYFWQNYYGITVTFDSFPNEGVDLLLNRILSATRHSNANYRVWSVHKVSEFCATFIVPFNSDLLPVANFISLFSVVSFITLNKPIRILNAVSRGVIHTSNFKPTYTEDINHLSGSGFFYQLTGENEIIGIADTGLDCDHPFYFDNSANVPYEWLYNDPNMPLPKGRGWHRKVVSYIFGEYGGDAFDSTSLGMHGTRVSGCAAGKTLNAYNSTLYQYNGIAYNAKLAFMDIGVESNLFLPSFSQLLAAFYSVGARIQSNSFGFGEGTGYAVYSDDYSSVIDLFLWNHRDMVVLVANGNCKNFAKAINHLAYAKNLISVSGSNGDGLAYFDCECPIYSDRSFSKPDIIAPGENIFSARTKSSNLDNTVFDYISYGSGTSFSSPITAGTVALLRQYFREGWIYSNIKNCSFGFFPSGVLLKASLLNSGNSLYIGPNPMFGFGRINLSSILFLKNSTQNFIPLFRNRTAYVVNSCSNKSYNFENSFSFGDDILENRELRETALCGYADVSGVVSSNIKITLVWYDYPGTSSSGGQLNNNLDLVVNDTGKKLIYYGNGGQHYSWGGSQLFPDAKNTVEQVSILAENIQTTKPYYVRVTAKRIAIGPQSYAVVASGPIKLAKRKVTETGIYYYCPVKDSEYDTNIEDYVVPFLPALEENNQDYRPTSTAPSTRPITTKKRVQTTGAIECSKICHGISAGYPTLSISSGLCLRFFTDFECLAFPTGVLGNGNSTHRECLSSAGGSISFSCKYNKSCCY